MCILVKTKLFGQWNKLNQFTFFVDSNVLTSSDGGGYNIFVHGWYLLNTDDSWG